MCVGLAHAPKKGKRKMKKLLIAFVAIASAMVVNAAACTWSTTGTIYQPTDSTSAVAGFTAYLFDTTTVSQSALVAALRDGGSITDYTAMSTYTTDSAAKVASTSFEQDSGKTINAYFAIVQDDYVYISNQKSGTTSDVGATPFSFASQSTSSKSVFDSTTAYSSAGWYQTVPEPTSGLLMLLGMAGLALRRRRA